MAKYNGYRLPNPPEYDVAVYPYAMILLDEDVARFYISPVPFVYEDPNINVSEGNGCPTFLCEFTQDSEYWMKSINSSGCTATAVIWTNYNIINLADNTVYLAASEPVYEVWSGQKSWLTGFVLGLAGKPLPIAGGGIDG